MTFVNLFFHFFGKMGNLGNRFPAPKTASIAAASGAVAFNEQVFSATTEFIT